MNTIINDENIKMLKLNYTLFDKFDDKVHFRVMKIESLLDNKKILGQYIDAGTIQNDGTISHCNIISNTPNKVPNTINLGFDNISKDYQLLFKLIVSGGEQLRISSAVNVTHYISNLRGYIAEEYDISSVDFEMKNEKEELYLIVIYPNNFLPPLIRIKDCYDANEILNIEDENTIYNSYYSNINSSFKKTTVELSDKINNVPWMKFEDNPALKPQLHALSDEYIDGDIYHNSAINFSYGKDVFSIGDCDFEKANKSANIKFEGNLVDIPYFDDIQVIFSELFTETNNFEDEAFIETNNEMNAVHIYHDSVAKYYNILVSGQFALFEYYNKGTIQCSICLVDIKEGTIISQFDCSYVAKNVIYKYSDIRNLEYSDIFCLPFEIDMIDTDALKFVNCINNLILQSNRSYDKTLNNILSGEDEHGKYILVRGVFGNLMKKYY